MQSSEYKKFKISGHMLLWQPLFELSKVVNLKAHGESLTRKNTCIYCNLSEVFETEPLNLLISSSLLVNDEFSFV